VKYVRSPWIPASLIVAVSAVAYIEGDSLSNRDKLVFTTVFVLLSVYVVEALTKKRP